MTRNTPLRQTLPPICKVSICNLGGSTVLVERILTIRGRWNTVGTIVEFWTAPKHFKQTSIHLHWGIRDTVSSSSG